VIVAVLSDFSVDRALRTLGHDDSTIEICTKEDPRGMRDAISLTRISQNPRLVLITVHHRCPCGAQNCPFWVYRLSGASPELVLNDLAVSVKAVPARASAVPEIVAVSHASAFLSMEIRYRFEGGKFVEAGAWKRRGGFA